METIRGLRYKLRMMGVQVDGPTYTFGDNLAVIRNASQPESTIKKKHNYVCYHAVRESVAMGEITCTHEASISNPTDIATKALPGGVKQDFLVSKILYDY